MSGLYRSGTVSSKSSGPTHISSYALKGIPMRYHPPSFVSDALRLSANRKLPTLPSQNMFRYDFTKERKVLEQSRVRTLSVIAEAEASKKREEEEQARRDSQPRAPVLSSTILLPTPASTTTAASGTGSGSNSDSEFAAPSGSSGTINVTASLGQFIREIEGVDDPFEIASLQAINDMEMLQTVLQPTAVSSAVVSPPAPATSAAATPRQARTVPSPVINQPAVVPVINQPPAPVMTQPPVANPALLVNPGPVSSHPQALPPAPQLPHDHTSHPTTVTNPAEDRSSIFGVAPGNSTSSPPAQLSPTATFPLPTAVPPALTNTNPFLSGSPAFNSTSVVGSNNPFVQGPPHGMAPGVVPGNGPVTAVGLPNAVETSRISPTLGASPSNIPSEPSVGTLIDIGAQLTPTPPIPIPRTPRPYASVAAPSSAPPLTSQQPHPQQSSGLDSGSPVMGFARSSGGPPPPIPPKPHPQPHPMATPISSASAGSVAGVGGSDSGNPPPRPPKPASSLPPPATVQSRVQALVANLPKLPNRPGLGIPVLPPISDPTTTTSTATGPNLQPSPPVPAPRHTPPLPCYAEQASEGVRSRPQPVPRPRTYKLPDPSLGMSAEEKTTVQSLSGMGFPGPRVARAVKRFDNDRAKTVDFLIAVGKLEEGGFSGDGAETALIISGEDHNKAVDYLKRVKQYKDIGFPEKAIHEAHEKAGKDWDRVLDILTQER